MKKICLFFVFSLMYLFFSACSGIAMEPLPYIISGQFEMEENSVDYEVCGLNLFVYNKLEKEIKEMTVDFYLFDRYGEPAMECQNRISLIIEKEIGGNESAQLCIRLDNYMISIPSELLEVDYLFLSKIVYEDGSEWNDPVGLAAFR